jgi:hypothetical protein
MSHVEFFTVYAGESRLIPVRIQTADCSSFSLAGLVEVQARFRKKDGQALIKTYVQEGPLPGGVTVVDAASGRLFISLTPEDTANLKLGERQDFTLFVYRGNRAAVTSGAIQFKANVPGIHMNGARLVFNGVQTVQQVVTAFNKVAQPEYEVYFLGDGTQVLSAQTLTLSGGTDNKRVANFVRMASVLKPSV